jgi:hypothetical protein
MADWTALYSLIDQGLPSKDVILQFKKRDLREEDSTYPLGKLLAEINWDVGPLTFADLQATFLEENGYQFQTILDATDREAVETMKMILDRLTHFSLSHFCEINGWRENVIHYALFDDTAQLQVGALVTKFTKAYAEGNLPLEIDRYESESALRLARSFFNLKSVKENLLRPATKEPCLRDDPEYVASHPLTTISGEPLLLALRQGELILTKLGASLEERELVVLAPPERFGGTVTSLRTDHSTFIAAMTQRIREQRISIWDLHNVGSSPAITIPGCFVDCLLFKRPGEVAPTLAAVTIDNQLETYSLQGERLSSTLISDRIPRGDRHDYTLLFVHSLDGDERMFLRTDKQVASVSLTSGNPQIVVSDVLSRPHEAMSILHTAHHWSIQDCCLTTIKGQPVLAALRKDNVLLFLDPRTMKQAAAPFAVCEEENYGMSLLPNCLGFDLVLGKLSCTPRLPVLQGISLADGRVTPIEVPEGDIVSVVPLPGETQPGVFVGGTYAAPTVVTMDPRGQLRADTVVPVQGVRYLTVV